MTLDNYTITTEGNAYFNGRDAVLHKNGERVAKIALKDNRPAIYVKHGYDLGTEATRELRDDLGDERLEQLLDNLQHGFWYYRAPEIVREHGHYEDVWSAGRSGGWCIPRAANRDNDWHWWDECTIDAPFPTEIRVLGDPEGVTRPVESVDDLPTVDARRYWFFQCAEAITAEVEYLRTEGFDEAVRDAHAELEHSREAVLCRGEN